MIPIRMIFSCGYMIWLSLLGASSWQTFDSMVFNALYSSIKVLQGFVGTFLCNQWKHMNECQKNYQTHQFKVFNSNS